MSSPTCVSCQDRLNCSDSPLSITGNIIGILTFAYATLATVVYYLVAISNSDRDLNRLRDTLNEVRLEAMKVYSRAEQTIEKLPATDQNDKAELNEKRENLWKAVRANVFVSLNKQLTSSNLVRNENPGLYRKWRQRAHYLVAEKKVRTELQKINDCIYELKDKEATILERYAILILIRILLLSLMLLPSKRDEEEKTRTS